MSEQAKWCRRQSAECARMALLTTDETMRDAYADLARQWRQLAEHAERVEIVGLAKIGP
jgi:hypothetical protein